MLTYSLCLKKMSTCGNGPEKSSTAKINKHTASGYWLFTNCSFDTTKNINSVIIETKTVWKDFVRT